MKKIILFLFFILGYAPFSDANNPNDRTKQNADSATVYYQRYLSLPFDSVLLMIDYLKKAQHFEVRDSIWLFLGELYGYRILDRYGSIYYYKKGLPKTKKGVYSNYEELSYLRCSGMLSLIGKKRKALRILNKYEKDTTRLHKKQETIIGEALYAKDMLRELGKTKNYTPNNYEEAIFNCCLSGNTTKMNKMLKQAFKKYPNDGCLYHLLGKYATYQGKYKFYYKYYKTAQALGCTDEFIRTYYPLNEMLLRLHGFL